MRDAYQALTLARTLYEAGAREQALAAAEAGLTLGGYRTPLATWLRNIAAALVVVREQPSLAYRHAQELAGDRWPALRADLLAQLRDHPPLTPNGWVEICLHEGLIDDAIAAARRGAGHALVLQVAEAAAETRPEWVIETTRREAAAIMDMGRSQYYPEAVRWVQQARVAYRAAGREPEWYGYLTELITQHQRKYRLRPMLEALQR